MLLRLLPLARNDAEGNVFVWRAGAEADKARGLVGAFGIGDDLVRRRVLLVDEVGVKDLKKC